MLHAHIVPLGEGAATGNNAAVGVVTDGLEFPQQPNTLEVADMGSPAVVYREYLAIDRTKCYQMRSFIASSWPMRFCRPSS